MATIDPWHLKIDGNIIATYARAIEDLTGRDAIPARRTADHHAAGVDGTYPHPNGGPALFTAKTQRLRIWVSPFDADGNTVHANGPRAHLRENLDELWRICAGSSRDAHTIQWVDPTPSATRTLENTARIAVAPSGGSRLVRHLDLTLTYPWPFFRDVTTGLQTLGPFTGAQSFTPQGTAPLADLTLTCTSAGRLTHDQTGEYVEVDSIPSGSVIINQRPPRTVLSGGNDARHVFWSSHAHGLRFDAGTLANLTITGTWSLAYYPQHHG